MYDLVIRGGTVVDGTGGPSMVADVAVEGDRIVAVGTDLGAGRKEIDARGKIVTPASSMFTPIMTVRRRGTRKWRRRAGTASPPSSWAIAASASRLRGPTATTGLSA